MPTAKTGLAFFVPQTKAGQAEAVYNDLAAQVKSQLRWAITERRIFSLAYTHDKKARSIAVGQQERQEHHYEVAAIFESNVFVAVTRGPKGGLGVMMLINKDEVTSVVDFD